MNDMKIREYTVEGYTYAMDYYNRKPSVVCASYSHKQAAIIVANEFLSERWAASHLLTKPLGYARVGHGALTVWERSASFDIGCGKAEAKVSLSPIAVWESQVAVFQRAVTLLEAEGHLFAHDLEVAIGSVDRGLRA